MKLQLHKPKKALKSLLKQKPTRNDINNFKSNLIALLGKIEIIEKQPKDESEEHLKNNIRDFLRDTYYKDTNAINTKDKKDLVIHLTKETNSEVGVIIEAKRPTNINEMVSEKNANKKALHELILYYLNERITNNNNELKQLVITNINEWFIIDANYFDKHIYRNNNIKKLYETKVNDKKDNPWFYEEISKLIDKSDIDLPCVYFDIKKYKTALTNESKADDKELIDLYKILSAQHLLKLSTNNDSNSLNEKFYKELLHIIGLEEIKEGSKNIIRQKQTGINKASFIEMAINKLKTKGIHKVANLTNYGDTEEQRYFNIALELCITWINRILFLKLLEGQLLNYHKGNKEYCFLNIQTIYDFDELFKLFHNVLAVNIKDREPEIQEKYKLVPYLNSSLFEITPDLEDVTITIDSLDNNEVLNFYSSTVLKNQKAKAKGLVTLEYLFEFLNAYDFASEGEENIQEDNKTIINASVLGTVFEKINGYKDGSIYTPAFITMYMCRQSIRLAVIDKFNEVKGWNVKDFIELENEIKDRKEANTIINSIKICDPAVGSGHFLVSALNEVIAIKSELNILTDEQGKTLKDYEIEIINDELIITDENGNPFAYNPLNKESNRVQKTLFTEKQTIIENCLFGVDINPNSVKICRLRLWIELLKNAYYKNSPPMEGLGVAELETLPNIDINIKCGNSLISRFKLDTNLKEAFSKAKYSVAVYKSAIETYKESKSREEKAKLTNLIKEIKEQLVTTVYQRDPLRKKISDLRGQLLLLENNIDLFGKKLSDKDLSIEKKRIKLSLEKKEQELANKENSIIYKNAFEWRFEFPEVLNDKGEYVGFDLVIGNPPYIRHEEIKHLKSQLQKDYLVFNSSADLLTYFFEIGNRILKAGGILSFIVSNKFFKAAYGNNLRGYLMLNTAMQQIIEFDKVNIFDEATVKAAIIQFCKIEQNQPFTYLDVKEKTNNLLKLIEEQGTQYEQNKFNSNQWIFKSQQQNKVFEKIFEKGTPLSNWDIQIYRGLLTGLNEAFLIDEETKNQLIQENKNAIKIIKPLFRGREIEKYKANFQNTHLIFIPKGYTIKRNLPKDNVYYVSEPSPRYGNMEFDQAWEWLKNEFYCVATHLNQFKIKAEKRQDKGDYWWELRACDYYSEFEKPKIIWKRIGSKLRFCYDETGTYSLDSTCIATGNHLKYLVGVLNSKLIEIELNRYAPKTGTGDLIISVQALSPLRIPIPTEKHEKQMNTLVDKIIAAKQQNQSTTALEKQIDEMVYELYGLTKEEIEIVEQN